MNIILIGRSGAGKSSIAYELSKRMNYEVYEVGNYVKEKYMLENKLVTLDNNSNQPEKYSSSEIMHSRLNYVNSKIEKYGKNYFLKEMVKEIKNENVILCGLRSIEEVEYIVSKWSDFFLVGVVSDEDIILSRFISRDSNKLLSEEEAKEVYEKRKKMEHSLGTEKLHEICNYIIRTDDTDAFTAADMVIVAYNKYINEKE